MDLSCKSQTAQAKALSLKIFLEQEEKQAFENLLYLIKEKNNHFMFTNNSGGTNYVNKKFCRDLSF